MFDHVVKGVHFHLFMFINVAATIFILYVYPTLSEIYNIHIEYHIHIDIHIQYHVACQLAS